jgi:hypothetical protein
VSEESLLAFVKSAYRSSPTDSLRARPLAKHVSRYSISAKHVARVFNVNWVNWAGYSLSDTNLVPAPIRMLGKILLWWTRSQTGHVVSERYSPLLSTPATGVADQDRRRPDVFAKVESKPDLSHVGNDAREGT